MDDLFATLATLDEVERRLTEVGVQEHVEVDVLELQGLVDLALGREAA